MVFTVRASLLCNLACGLAAAQLGYPQAAAAEDVATSEPAGAGDPAVMIGSVQVLGNALLPDAAFSD